MAVPLGLSLVTYPSPVPPAKPGWRALAVGKSDEAVHPAMYAFPAPSAAMLFGLLFP